MIVALAGVTPAIVLDRYSAGVHRNVCELLAGVVYERPSVAALFE